MSDLLDSIEIASPCDASWDEMTGDEKSRHCASCQLNVYNLSAMSRDEASAFIQKQEGRVCVRLYKRPDGKVITSDCPVGIRRKRRRQLGIAAAIAMVCSSLFAWVFMGRGRTSTTIDSYADYDSAYGQVVNRMGVEVFLAHKLKVLPCACPPIMGMMVAPAPAPVPVPTPAGSELEGEPVDELPADSELPATDGTEI